MFQENLYHDHGVNYSTGGYLAEKRFAGPTATFTEVNYPAQQCQAPGKETYGVNDSFSRLILETNVFYLELLIHNFDFNSSLSDSSYVD